MTGYDRDVRSGGARPTRLSRLAGPALAIVACIVLLGAAPPPAAPVAESIRHLVGAPTQGGGGGGGLLGSGFGLILLVGLGIAVVVVAWAAYVLFRTRGPKVIPPSEGWWTCTKCGAGNMDGAARCHACAAWRTATPNPTPSASP